MHTHQRTRRGWTGAATLLLALSLGTSTAWAEATGPAGPAETCADAVHGPSARDLRWSTDPASGSEVSPGQTVAVRLIWDPGDFRGDQLGGVLACVTVDGRLDTALGTSKEPAANDGEFQYSFRVPDDVPDQAKLCGRGLVTGDDRHGKAKREVSSDQCLKIKAATAPTAEPSPRPAGAVENCPSVLPGPANGSLQNQSDLADGSEVRPGQVVQTWLFWRPADFAGQMLDQVLHCVTVNGELDLNLSTVERPTRNDGEFVQQLTIPSGLAAGTRICDRGFISGEGAHEAFLSEKSNDLCLKLVEPPPAAPAFTASQAPPVEDTCINVVRGEGRSSPARITNVGTSTARPGQELEVNLTWNTADFAGSALHQMLDCVTVDGRLDTSLSIAEQATPNDGSFAHRFSVPSGLPAGARLCNLGFVSGTAPNGDFDRQRSNDVCFTVSAVAATPARPLAAVAQAVSTAPAPAGALAELPRTGPRPLEYLLAFFAFLAGGLAIVVTSRLSRRRFALESN